MNEFNLGVLYDCLETKCYGPLDARARLNAICKCRSLISSFTGRILDRQWRKKDNTG